MKRTPKKTIEKMQALYDEGVPVKAIARQCKVSPSTVYNMIRGSYKSPKQAKEPRWLYLEHVLADNGWLHQDFTDRAGFSRQQLYKWNNNVSSPRMDNLIIICKTLEVVDGTPWLEHAVIMLANEWKP